MSRPRVEGDSLAELSRPSPTSPVGSVSPDVTSVSYFPRSHRSSTSSFSSVSSTGDDELPRQPPSRSSTLDSRAGSIPVDPLSRHYPKPATDINVAEALAREPRRWSLAYWVKNGKEISDLRPNAEAQRRKFEETKEELLKARLDMAQLPATRRQKAVPLRTV